MRPSSDVMEVSPSQPERQLVSLVSVMERESIVTNVPSCPDSDKL
jgi:hypothetical protein